MAKKRKQVPMPEKPLEGDIWFNFNNRKEYQYRNGKWINTTTNEEMTPKLLK